MTSFDSREEAFEAKFAHDAEREFKAALALDASLMDAHVGIGMALVIAIALTLPTAERVGEAPHVLGPQSDEAQQLGYPVGARGLANSVEAVVFAERLDGFVGMAGCDKSMPAMLTSASIGPHASMAAATRATDASSLARTTLSSTG